MKSENLKTFKKIFKINRRSFILKMYFFITRYFEFLFFLFLKYRLIKGKEDKIRFLERKGRASLSRPESYLIWFNAASVGEALSILYLIEKLGKNNKKIKFLITTTTISSSLILKKMMPRNCIHQFSPIDTFSSTKNFLDHWQPDLVIFVESEFWPRLIFDIKKQNIPLGLINARMEKKTFEKWSKIKMTSKQILDKFDFVYANDHLTAKRLLSLGISKKKLLGVLSSKEQASPLIYNLRQYNKLKKILKNKKIWVAASTHEGEEEILINAQKKLHGIDKNFFLILIPRHPNRIDGLFEKIKSNSYIIKIRSKEQKITEKTSIYLADTLGELGLWYKLSKIVFLGGSLVNIGGHNPYEPCRFGSAIITGPYVYNFQKGFDQLNNAGAIKYVRSVRELVESIQILSNNGNANLVGQKGLKYVNSLEDHSSPIIKTINTFL